MENLSNFHDFFRNARGRIIIHGTHPLNPDLEKSAEFFFDMLRLNENLSITIFVESDSECFNQSLCLDSSYSGSRHSFASLLLHRDRVMGKTPSTGLLAAVKELSASQSVRGEDLSVAERLKIYQLNLRLSVNFVVADDKIWTSTTTNKLPKISDYNLLDTSSTFYGDVLSYVSFLENEDGGKKYLSVFGDELIQMYDKNGIARGIYPRNCFYSTEYQRYSIWGFVFNRKGQLLLHQRGNSPEVIKDGAGLWDKSVGGHVDLKDSSTSVTAERELIEEMFLPEAEHTKHMKADMGDIIHFGEWNLSKRNENALAREIAGLSQTDWVMFRATDDNRQPLTISRVSDRRFSNDKNKVEWKRTVFRSDVYFFVAPQDYIDTDAQMKRLLSRVETKGKGAAQNHKLVTIGELRDWIDSEEKQGKAKDIFTDDIIYVNLCHRDILEEFSEFAKLLDE